MCCKQEKMKLKEMECKKCKWKVKHEQKQKIKDLKSEIKEKKKEHKECFMQILTSCQKDKYKELMKDKCKKHKKAKCECGIANKQKRDGKSVSFYVKQYS